MKLTSEQQEAFRDRGYLYLPGALGRNRVQPVKAHVLKALKKQKIWVQGKVLSGRLKSLPAFQQINKLSQLVQYPSLTEQLIPESLHAIARRLSGSSLVAEQDANLLISLPNQGSWTLEGLDWHRDVSAPSQGRMPGVQAFVLLDNLSSHGGGTLALAGSHKLSGQSRSKQNIDRLVRDNPHSGFEVDGMDLSILEMSGMMGDVYLMDLRLLHTPSINAANSLRLMATVRFFAN